MYESSVYFKKIVSESVTFYSMEVFIMISYGLPASEKIPDSLLCQ